ncbi:ADP-ribosylhydrolase ARH3 isoform X1 [Parasteatoda tepidariorum]|uniref:ADP-ribosylhydrolase ARH3 isoform X1 n=1 Tax=Parasteatoda tepidariorum TaxID=114398 RepID=UPI001C724344|nr:ADP-ribose glycohydrolase ARH3 isoform X1 [Parasteatoda tepidariorum]
MATSKLETTGIAVKFKGCLIGALIGDCFGAPFEFCTNLPVSEKRLKNFFTEILNGETEQIYPYTDDTAMTLSVTKSLIENKKICPIDLAKRFVNEYFTDPETPERSYGAHVRHVFVALRKSNFEDVFLPAKNQFDGKGSYGNGAAMRIAPVALFVHDKDDDCIKNAVEQCSFLTHTHPDGYNGALLLCLAIHLALKLDSSEKLDSMKFILELLEKMERIENKGNSPYCDSLKKMKNIFEKKKDLSPQEVGENFGNSVIALKSVPTAIYSFLRAQKKLPNYKNTNPFIRTIYFAISVGGDTDTIATMAGAIAGAYYGDDIIPKQCKERCDKIKEVEQLADELLKASYV